MCTFSFVSSSKKQEYVDCTNEDQSVSNKPISQDNQTESSFSEEILSVEVESNECCPKSNIYSNDLLKVRDLIGYGHHFHEECVPKVVRNTKTFKMKKFLFQDNFFQDVSCAKMTRSKKTSYFILNTMHYYAFITTMKCVNQCHSQYRLFQSRLTDPRKNTSCNVNFV